MVSQKKSQVKLQQKVSFLYREIAELIANLAHDEPILATIYPTRVELSPGKEMCYVYFASHDGKEQFEEALEVLKLYKPSLRQAIAKARQARRTPDLRFLYDESLEKGRRMEKLLDNIREKDRSSSD